MFPKLDLLIISLIESLHLLQKVRLKIEFGLDNLKYMNKKI